MDADELTHDAFLGGRIHLWQPRRGYRAGLDPVLLAASLPVRAGERVLELGCGAGTALMCLHARCPGLHLTGVEVQTDYADLARRNAGDLATIHTADLRALPDDLRQQQFHHVMMNPPYFDRDSGHAAADKGRDLGRGGDTPLVDWLDIGIRRLAPKGFLSVIQHITRLPEVLAAVSPRLGSIAVLPIQPRDARPPNLFILQARQSGRAPFVMLPPLVMHAGQTHIDNSESYTPVVRDILRNAASLPISP